MRRLHNISLFCILALAGLLRHGNCWAQPISTASPSAQIRVENLSIPTLAPMAAPSRPIEAAATRKITNTSTLSAAQLSSEQAQISSLSFSWNMPVALAVFKRGEKLWIVFDHPQKIDIDALKEAAGDLATNIIQFPHPAAAIIELAPQPDVKYTVRKEGLLWVVDLYRGKTPANIPKDIPLFTQYDSGNRPYLFIPGETAGNLVMAIDPDVGDIITVAPISETGWGFNHTYFYPEFAFLQSAQGLAMVIKTPDIFLNRGNTGLTLRALERGLNISEDLEMIKRQQIYRSSASQETFDIQVAPQLLQMDFKTAIDQLNKDIATAQPAQKTRARLELAKYYISQAMGTEALAILKQIEAEGISETNAERFQALNGVANFLARRYAEAQANFEYGRLPSFNEAVFWRTLAAAAQEFKQEYNVILFSFLALIRDYPQELKDQIAVIGAQTALEAGDDLAAQNFIDILRSDNNRFKNRTAQIAYLSAKKLELQGYPRNAIKDYRRIANMNDQYYSSLARYDNAVLSQRLNMMKLPDAIAELEKLRFAWGEPKFKWQLMTKLADFYVKNHDYYSALRTLKDNLALSTPKQHQQLSKRMLTWFEDIFLNNQADSTLSAIKALALYQDFGWLAEKSPYQNQITQKLADRLVAVDLLPRATKLLEELLKRNDLSVEERGKIGARLAIINLFEQKSDTALLMLDQTENPALSNELQSHRRVIRSRTLANQGRIDEALALLDNDYSKNALLLQTDIYWTGRQWAQAADTLRYLVEKPTPGQPLSVEQIAYILDWATALKKSGKETVLIRLRNKFLPYFADTKYHSVFNILTNHLENDKIDLKEINKVINDVENYSNFAKIYNDSLKSIDLK